MAHIDHRLLYDFVTTDRQREMLDAVITHGSHRKAAKVLKINSRTIDKSMKRLQIRAACKGVAPHRGVNRQTMEGFEAKRISTAYKGDTGEVALQWVIQEKE